MTNKLPTTNQFHTMKEKNRGALYGHLCNIHFRSHCTLVRASKTSYTLCYVKFMLRMSLSAKANPVCRMSYAKTNDSAVAIDLASQPTTHTIHSCNAAVFILFAVATAAVVVKVCFVQFQAFWHVQSNCISQVPVNSSKHTFNNRPKQFAHIRFDRRFSSTHTPHTHTPTVQ